MKVNKKPKEAPTNDGTPFPTKFELKELNYLKLCGNHDKALYSVFDAKADKLYGFVIMLADESMHKVDIKQVNFKELQP